MSLPRLPPGVPRYPQSTARRLCARWFESSGWRTAGVLPDTAKLVVIAAPHSSWWDGFWGLLLKYALGIDVSFMAKRQLFRGPFGELLRALGGIPIERDAAHGVVEQMIGRFADRDALWLAIAPEGTRKPVRKWKMGFWHIARGARVPILPVYFDYPSKTIGFGPLLVPGADASADLAQLRAFYAPWRGKRHGIG